MERSRGRNETEDGCFWERNDTNSMEKWSSGAVTDRTKREVKISHFKPSSCEIMVPTPIEPAQQVDIKMISE